MSYVITYILAIFAPGWALLCRSALPLSIRISLSVLISYAVFLFFAFCGFVFSAEYQIIVYAWFVTVIALAIWGGYRCLYSQKRTIHIANAGAGALIFAMTILLTLMYLLWAGPYLELPSDSWWHLGQMQDKYEAINNDDSFQTLSLSQYLYKDRGYWYLMHAGIAWLSGHTIQTSIPYVAVANPLVFLISVYGFALFIFRKMSISDTQLHFIASLSVVFFVVYFGVSVFSYIRYYALAPVMLNYVVYLGMTALFVSWLEGKTNTVATTVLLTIGALVLSAVHKQEMMFFLIAMAGMTTYAFILMRKVRPTSYSDAAQKPNNLVYNDYKKVVVLFTFMAVIYLILHGYLYISEDRHSALKHARLIDINNFLPFLKNLYILDPTKNFYATITVWGVLIYSLYFYMRKSFTGNLYITALMFVPFFTIFNPVFVDLFLRVSWSDVLWRISYMLPLSFLGAYFLVYHVRHIKEAKNITHRLVSCVVVALIVILLFPIENRFVEANEDRFVTLGKVPRGNDHRNWSDLIDYLLTQPKRTILTDRVTGYIVNGLTHHVHYSHKFYGYKALPLNKVAYQIADFERRDGWLLIVNLRDGLSSRAGKLSGHWPENILKLKNEYSTEFLTFVEQNGRLFKQVWSAPSIKVFEINKG